MRDFIKLGDDLEGEKKGGGAGRSAQEAPNTLRSRASVRVLEVLSEGEIEGFCDSTGATVTGNNVGKAFYFDDTPVQNADGSFNYSGVSYGVRFGLPNQEYMAGFPSVEAIQNINQKITTTDPKTYYVNNAWDSVRLTIQLPQGLYKQDTSNGDLLGSEVRFAIDVFDYNNNVITSKSLAPVLAGKTMSPYEVDYRLERPTSSGGWSFRVRRITADNQLASIKNDLYVARYTLVNEVKLPYNYTAYVGIAVDAESTGGSIPTRSYDIKGIKVQVPVNYNPITRVYTGQWNGQFKTAWTDNPAWILYDLLTNDRYGLGEVLVPASENAADVIDKYSFYTAATYNDQLVPDGYGGTEPRFTFNGVINSQEDAIKVLQAVASTMRATLIYSGGLLWINQDRPSDPVKLVTNANVIDGNFNYIGTPLQSRHTVARISYNDKKNKYFPDVVIHEDVNAIAKYGYNVIEQAAYGATTPGQALRHAKWLIDTELNNSEIVNYKASLNQFDLQVGDVIRVHDNDWMQLKGSGRVLAVNSASSFKLDRVVNPYSVTNIEMRMPDNTIQRRAVSNINGDMITCVPFSQLPEVGTDFILIYNNYNRLFRVLDIKQEDTNIVSVTALYYDPNKYSRVELGINGPTNPYPGINQNTVNPVTNIGFWPEFFQNAEYISRRLRVSWRRPQPNTSNGRTDVITKYIFKWRKDNDNYATEETDLCEFIIPNGAEGIYDVIITAVNAAGVNSPPTYASYRFTTQGTGTSPLLAVTNLQIVGGGNIWNERDMHIEWTNPSGNAARLDSDGRPAVLKDFKVVISADNTTVHTAYVSAVAAGAQQKFLYNFTQNTADNRGVPKRALTATVYCRDSKNNLSDPTYRTFTNPVPSAVSNFTVRGVIQGFQATWSKPPDSDLAGILVWGSTQQGFSPSASTLIYNGIGTGYTLNHSSNNAQNWYFYIAAYDTFWPYDATGNGLNITGTFGRSTTPGVPGGPSSERPMEGNQIGDIRWNTDLEKLEVWDGTQWVFKVPFVDVKNVYVEANQINVDSLLAHEAFIDFITVGQLRAYEIGATNLSATSLSAYDGTFTRLHSGMITGGDMYDSNWGAGPGFMIGEQPGVFSGIRMGSAGGRQLEYDASTGVLTLGALVIAEVNSGSVEVPNNQEAYVPFATSRPNGANVTLIAPGHETPVIAGMDSGGFSVYLNQSGGATISYRYW